jgi:hypothetical protein
MSSAVLGLSICVRGECSSVRLDQSIERTSTGRLRGLAAAAHVER